MTISYTFGERQLQLIEDVLQSQPSQSQPAVAGPLILAHPQCDGWINSHSLTSDNVVSNSSNMKSTSQFDFFLPTDLRVPSSWIIPEPIIHEVTDIPADETGLLSIAGGDVSENTEETETILNEILENDLGLRDLNDTDIEELMKLESLLELDQQENNNEAKPTDSNQPFQTLSNEVEAQVTFRAHELAIPNSSNLVNLTDLSTFLLGPSGSLSTGDTDFASYNSPIIFNTPTVLDKEFGLRPGRLNNTTGKTAEEDKYSKKIDGKFHPENEHQTLNTLGENPNIAIQKLMDLSMKTHLSLRDISSPSSSSSSSNDGDSEASSRKRTKRSGSDDDQREKNNTSSRKSREKKARTEKDNEVKCRALEDEHEHLIQESEMLRKEIEELHNYHSSLLRQVSQRLWNVF